MFPDFPASVCLSLYRATAPAAHYVPPPQQQQPQAQAQAQARHQVDDRSPPYEDAATYSIGMQRQQ